MQVYIDGFVSNAFAKWFCSFHCRVPPLQKFSFVGDLVQILFCDKVLSRLQLRLWWTLLQSFLWAKEDKQNTKECSSAKSYLKNSH